MKFRILYIVSLVNLISCSSPREITYENTAPQVNTGGIYIAENPHVVSYSAEHKLDTANRLLQIIRFLSKDVGIIVPVLAPNNLVLTDSKVAEYYNWCLQYDKKNPTDKDYIRFNVHYFAGDSIAFQQVTQYSRTIFQCQCFKDSLKAKYCIDVARGAATHPKLWKRLDFKFYANPELSQPE